MNIKTITILIFVLILTTAAIYLITAASNQAPTSSGVRAPTSSTTTTGTANTGTPNSNLNLGNIQTDASDTPPALPQ